MYVGRTFSPAAAIARTYVFAILVGYYVYIYIYRERERERERDLSHYYGGESAISAPVAPGAQSILSTISTIFSAFPLVGASNVGEFLHRCDPLTQTLFVFRC